MNTLQQYFYAIGILGIMFYLAPKTADYIDVLLMGKKKTSEWLYYFIFLLSFSLYSLIWSYIIFILTGINPFEYPITIFERRNPWE